MDSWCTSPVGRSVSPKLAIIADFLVSIACFAGETVKNVDLLLWSEFPAEFKGPVSVDKELGPVGEVYERLLSVGPSV